MKGLRTTTAGALVTCVLLVSEAAAGQGLGEAAKRAKEQRKENAGKGTRIEIIQEGWLAPIKLDRKVVEEYTNARIAMAKLWQRDPNMYQRVRIAVQNARGLREYSTALDAEPPVAELLKLYQYTPETFLATELTLRATESRAEGGFDYSQLSDIEKENHDWIARNLTWLSLMRGRVAKAEGGMSLWQ